MTTTGRVTRAQTATGRAVRRAVRGIRAKTPAGKIAVIVGAELGGIVGDAAQRMFTGLRDGAGDEKAQHAEGTGAWSTGHGPRVYHFNGKVVCDYYEVLEVSSRARQSVIDKAYRALIRENHPDQGGDPGRARLLNEAYEVLRDPVKRRQYDEQNGF